MSHSCKYTEGNGGCISCYAAGEDQGAENVVNMFRAHQVQGFISNESGSGFICSCNPDIVLNYNQHLNNLISGDAEDIQVNNALRSLLKNYSPFSLNTSPLPKVSGHTLTGESVSGFLARCSCGEAVDNFREHLMKVKCHCFTCNNAEGQVWWMVTCILCGNKQCPHAQYHENKCCQKGSSDE